MAKQTREAANAQPNFVAKHAQQFNKAAVFVDRKKAAKKGAIKHKGRLFDVLLNGFLAGVSMVIGAR